MERRSREDGWQPADCASMPVLFVNPSSGGGVAARSGLVEHARRRGIDVVVLRRGESLAELVRQAIARGADALGIAGGDGPLGVVAAAALAHGLPFVCVPAGTRNHFALDLGIDPHDLIGSLEAFEGGVERRIDVGEVNGRLFLNNVSLGVYGDAVRHTAYRDAKLRTLLTTAVEGLGPSAAVSELHVVDEIGGEHRSPALVLVSNNPYVLDRPLASAARSWTVVGSASSSSTGHSLAGACGEPGARQHSRCRRRGSCTVVWTARRSLSIRHFCSSADRPPCEPGSRPAIRASVSPAWATAARRRGVSAVWQRRATGWDSTWMFKRKEERCPRWKT